MTDLVAQYWTKPITRREAQAVFDELSSAVNSMREHIVKMDFTITYLAEKAGVQPAEFQEWVRPR